MDALIYSLSLAGIAFLVAIAFKPVEPRLTIISCLLFSVYLAVDDFATGLTYLAPVFDFLPGGWNWEGKLYSIIVAVTVLRALRIDGKAAGLTLAQRNLKASLVVSLLYLPWAAALGFYFDPGVSAETLAFQATMPGVAEELALRGIAPALLLGLIHGKQPQDGVPWAVVWISAIMFAVWHALGYSDGSYSFDVLTALLTGFGGAVACWLRFNSGSLLFPILLHGAANVTFHLTALVGGS